MIKINNANYSDYFDLLYIDSPSFSGILAGESAGEVWVDNPEHPTIAMVYSNAVGGFSFMGEPEDKSVYGELRCFFENELFDELKSKGIHEFEFSVESKETEGWILELFSDKKLEQEEEYFYQKSDECDLLTLDEYEIVKIDSGFIAKLRADEYGDSEMLRKRLMGSWHTYEQFSTRSIGFAALKDQSIASIIIGTARYQNVIPIDIITNKDHRKKGLATYLTHCFVNECVQNGLIAQWNCVDSNKASRNTADKVGFRLLKKKSFYWFDI